MAAVEFRVTARLPRCTFRGCPVRYAGGEDRPCPEHHPDADADKLAAAYLQGAALAPSGAVRQGTIAAWSPLDP